MSSVVISGDSSGTVTLTVPSAAGTNTATLPAATGTVMVSGNMPAFSAYQATQQTGVSASTWTKVNLDTEVFDTNNNFASSRFTPTVAGYYQITGATAWGFTTGLCVSGLYKNGTQTFLGGFNAAVSVGAMSSVSGLIYLNGSTDYVELWTYQSNGTNNVSNSSYLTYMTGVLVRA